MIKDLQPSDLSITYCKYPINEKYLNLLKDLKQNLNYNPVTGLFTWLVSKNRVRSGQTAGCKTSLGYIQISFQGKVYRAHRLAWFFFYGTFPEKSIDHINRIRWDNSISNLRDVNGSDNGKNMSLSVANKSGHAGVHYYVKKGKWVARIQDQGKRIHLGYFINKEDAINARKRAEEEYGYITV